ncbi:MAG: alpha/beta hydrolase fold domain-containing protein [Pseudomonadota bacterium]
MTGAGRGADPLTPAAYAALLDPAYRAAAAALPAEDLDWATADPAVLRAAYDASHAVFADDAAAVAVSGWPDAAGSGGLAFRPEGAPAGVAVLYFHGGGWIVGSPQSHRVAVSHLAAGAGIPVVSARYRLAPEHPYPAQVEDAVAAVARLAPDAERLVLAGDSAGAALAFWTWDALAPDLQARIAGIVGIYGAYGLGDSASRRRFGPVCPGLSDRDIAAYRAHLGLETWTGTGAAFDTLERQMAEGPPVFLAGAALDPVLDDTTAMAARLEALGRPVEAVTAEALPHGFIHFVGRVPAAAAVLAQAAAWIRTRLIPA